MGRPAALSDEQIRLAIALKQQGLTWPEVARKLSVHRATVERAVKSANGRPVLQAIGALAKGPRIGAKLAQKAQNLPGRDYLPDVKPPSGEDPIEHTIAAFMEISKEFWNADDKHLKGAWAKIGLEHAKFLYGAQQEQQSAEDAGVDRMAKLTMRIEQERDKLREQQEGQDGDRED